MAEPRIVLDDGTGQGRVRSPLQVVQTRIKPKRNNTRGFTVDNTPVIIFGANSARSGLIVQNLSAVNPLFVSFQNSNDTAGAILIPPTGQMALDFAVTEPMFAFCAAGASVSGIVLESSGFDAFQTAVLMALDRVANNVVFLARHLK